MKDVIVEKLEWKVRKFRKNKDEKGYCCNIWVKVRKSRKKLKEVIVEKLRVQNGEIKKKGERSHCRGTRVKSRKIKEKMKEVAVRNLSKK